MNHQSTCNGDNIPQLQAESLISTKFLNVMDDSQLVGVPVTVAGDSIVSDHTTVLSVEVKTDVKRKRGRPPRGQAKLPPVKKQKDDEDVCFICFDGGSLVLCDRRSCPKAYHPACIKRDEAFFRSKARWNCGWHICSVCQKAAHYMCYTCPFSLCKGCTKDSSYLCVRGDKGFCTTCMKVIMLIENEQRNTEMTQVDFDDASNWEYLFKIYYISLKEKLSLTTKDLAEAKTPWKESASMTGKGQSSNVHGGANNFKSAVSSMSSGHLKGGDSIRQNSCESLKLLNKASLTTEKQCTDNDTSSQGRNDWATKELLEFVAYMKNGDTSVLSQFDVQSLVLDYIKRSNLHDPCEKNHVACDSRLEILFGKPRVGHLEMLKLLDFHFLVKKEAANDDLVEGRVVDINAVQVPSDQSNSISMNKDKKYKTCKKGEECALQASLTEYAAVNVHNINLIYLRRNLMENLIQVREKFHEMVVGAMVRIRVSGDEHKQDMYRLVQVVGTTKVSAPYQISNITTDIMLEVSNLDKKEVLSIDAISDQDFSEHECRHLRQSVKSGFVKRFTVGEIQEKAMQLQVVRLSNNLEAEMSQLNHLRDRASKNGVEEEVRECVEKLQLLKAPEERQRRLSQIPEVSSDPNMDPNYESEEDAVEHDSRKQGHHEKPCNPEYNREGSEPISLRQREDISGDNNSSSPPCERIKNSCATSYPDKEESAAKALQRLSEEKYAWRLNSLERGELNNQAVTSTALFSMRNTPFAYNGETKLWHYRDLNGYIRGPFSIVELQRWSIAGYFSPDMRIWANDKLDDSVLLTDALEGHFHKALPGLNDISSQVREVRGTSDSNLYNSRFVWSENTNATEDGRQNEGNWHDNIADANSKCKDVFIRSDRLGTESSAWTAPIVSYNKDITAGTASQDQGSFKGNSLHNMLLSSTLAVRDDATHPHELNSKVKRCDSDSDHKISLSQGTTICNNTGHILGNHCNCQGCANQVSGKSVTHSHVNCSPNNLDLNSVFSPTKSTDSPDQSGEVIINLHSPSRNTSNIDLECEADKNASLSFNVNGPDFRDQPNSTLKINNNHQKCLAAEKKRCVSLNIPVQESVSSWGSTTNIMAGKSQLPDITDEWGGYTSAPVKHSIEWDSNLISVSSSSLHDHVGTTTSRSELTHFTLSNPASNFFSWHTTGSEPIEFTTLAEESVSDLLAEVDAMESQCGMVSPTSMMNCGEDLINLNLEMA